MTSEWLRRTFGRVRASVLPGTLEWIAPRDATGKSGDVAEALNEDRSAWADVVPTMRLLLANAQAGKYDRRGDQILQRPAFGFGCWCSDFTALREQLRDSAPRAKKAAPAGPAYGLLRPVGGGSR